MTTLPVVPDLEALTLAARAELRAGSTNPMVRSFPQGAIVVFDDDLRYLCAGGLGLADVGLSQEMLEGNTVFDVFPADVVDVIEPMYRRALAGDETSIDVPYEGRIYLQRLGPLRDARGNIIAGMGFTQDVTQARRAEYALRESEERFRLAFDNGPIPMALIGLDGRYEQVNPTMCEFSGYSAERLQQLTVTELTHPGDLDSDLAATAALLSGETGSYTLDERYLTSTGKVVWGAKSATLVRREDGSPEHFLVQIQDITVRKLHEQALVEERQRLRNAEAIGQVGSWTLDLRTRDVVWSVGLFELYGLDPTHSAHDYATRLNGIHPDDRAVMAAAVDECASTGQPLRSRYRIQRATDGALRWMDTRGEVEYEDGVAVRICGAVADVTDRVTAEAAAEAAQSFQQAVFDASPDIIGVYDLAKRSVTWANRSIPEMLGFDAADMAALPARAMNLVVDEDRPGLQAALVAAQAATDDAVIDVDYRMITKAGPTRWFSQRTAPLRRDRDGRVSHVVGVLHDNTEGRAVQDALERSEGTFRQFAGSVDVAFVLRTWDPPAFVYVSPGFEKVFGYDPMLVKENPDGTRLRIHPDDLEDFDNRYLTLARAGQPTQAEYRIIRPDGQVRWIRSKSSPVDDSWEHGGRSASTSEDITAHRDAEAAMFIARDAERANTAKNEFLSRMSHELRTPLNAVLGFAQLLELDPLSIDQTHAVHYILRGGRHLLGLIDDVLDISKIEGDRLDLSLEPVAVSRLVSETIELMAAQALTANVLVHHESSATAERGVRADHRRLRQVMLNLLSNAIKYNRPGGRVDVSYAVSGETNLDIIVSDTGRGIRAENLSRLFIPFDRLDAASSDIEGTGVGLALSHRLMTLMNGTLTARSSFGLGSAFTATIPLAAGIEAEVGPVPPMLPSTGRGPRRRDLPGRTLLYIEDNSSNTELMERLLTRRPEWTLTVAGHGALGLELATNSPPDLVMLDLHLPDMDGVDVLRQLRADPRTEHLVIVIVSADASPNQVTRLLAAGAQAYLTKPLYVPEVLALLDSTDELG